MSICSCWNSCFWWPHDWMIACFSLSRLRWCSFTLVNLNLSQPEGMSPNSNILLWCFWGGSEELEHNPVWLWWHQVSTFTFCTFIWFIVDTIISILECFFPSLLLSKQRGQPPSEEPDDRRQPGRGVRPDTAPPAGGDCGSYHGHQVPEYSGGDSDRAPWEGKRGEFGDAVEDEMHPETEWIGVLLFKCTIVPQKGTWELLRTPWTYAAMKFHVLYARYTSKPLSFLIFLRKLITFILLALFFYMRNISNT